MSETTVKELFSAGAHFGHRTSRWHPKMAPYIHSVRGGIHVIDLVKTESLLASAMDEVSRVASKGREILIVGTKQQAKSAVEAVAKSTDMPHIANRWMGGLLTNYKTIGERIKRLKELEKRMDSGELVQRYSKLEVQRYQEEIDGLNEQFGGIKEMSGLPAMMFVVDVLQEKTAVKEAIKLGIPIIAIVDTNVDPSVVDYPIPANDDALKTIELILGYFEQAVLEGKKQATQGTKNKEPGTRNKEQTSEVKEQEDGMKQPAEKINTKKPVAKKSTAKKPVTKSATKPRTLAKKAKTTKEDKK